MIELAVLRNHLYNGHWQPEDQELLARVRADVSTTESPFRAIALNAIDNALQDVAERRYEQAGRELNFIHNLDLENGFRDGWNELYFFGSYVGSYLSDVQDLDRARRLLVLLGQAVNAQEQDPAYRERRRQDRVLRARGQVRHPDKVIWAGGQPGVGLDEREKYAMETYSGDLLWETAVTWEPAGHHKPAWVGWPEAGVLLLGGGQELYAFDLDTGAVRHHQLLDNYFMRLALTPDRTRLLVLDGTSVAALDTALQELWRTSVGVDGVMLHDLDDDQVHVDAELDPPGGWKAFVLDARTGKVMKQG